MRDFSYSISRQNAIGRKYFIENEKKIYDVEENGLFRPKTKNEQTDNNTCTSTKKELEKTLKLSPIQNVRKNSMQILMYSSVENKIKNNRYLRFKKGQLFIIN